VIRSERYQLTINKPKAYWLDTLTYPTDFIVSKAEAGKVSGPMTDAEVSGGAGTGPFKLVSYLPDQQAVLAANAHYWDGAPSLAGQNWAIEKDAGTRHALYVSGQLDIVDETPGDVAADSADPVLKDQIRWFPRAQTYYVALNQTAFAPFKDVRVRQALAYATDKSKLVRIVVDGKMDAAQDILAEGMPGYDPSFLGIPYDPGAHYCPLAWLVLLPLDVHSSDAAPSLAMAFRSAFTASPGQCSRPKGGCPTPAVMSAVVSLFASSSDLPQAQLQTNSPHACAAGQPYVWNLASSMRSWSETVSAISMSGPWPGVPSQPTNFRWPLTSLRPA
jgi:hypothetical protein